MSARRAASSTRAEVAARVGAKGQAGQVEVAGVEVGALVHVEPLHLGHARDLRVRGGEANGGGEEKDYRKKIFHGR